MVLEIFSARVREARLAAGLTQTELDAALDLKPGCVAKWEAGERLPRAESLDKLEKVFNQPISRFFDREGLGSTPRAMGRPKSNSGATAGATPKPDSTGAQPKVNELAPARKGRRKLSGRPLCPPNPHPHWLAPTICEYPIAS